MKFEIGEIAVLISGSGYVGEAKRYENSEVEIMSSLLPIPNIMGGHAYDVKTSDGMILEAIPSMLRKKKPPQETTTWEAIQALTNWNPAKEVA